ncbi:MAG: hypothetical protein ACOCYW_03785 [Roseicyclus sp.]
MSGIARGSSRGSGRSEREKRVDRETGFQHGRENGFPETSMPLGFFAHNMSLSEFANECERKTDTIADWRKRGMIQSYGRPHPSHDGRWLYSREDAMAVYISGMLKDYAGLAWTSALDAGMQITKIILVLPINRMSIGGIAYIFETENKTNVSFSSDRRRSFQCGGAPIQWNCGCARRRNKEHLQSSTG